MEFIRSASVVIVIDANFISIEERTAMRINHNLPALLAYNAHDAVRANVGKIIQRLSTGLRINSAADDAAGLVVPFLSRFLSEKNFLDFLERIIANPRLARRGMLCA